MSVWKTATSKGIELEKRYNNKQWEFKTKGLSGIYKSFLALEKAVAKLNAPQLAGFIKHQGTSDLQQYSWWSNHSQKQEAWKRINGERNIKEEVFSNKTQENLIDNIEDLWSDYVQIEQELNENPEMRNQLFEEAKQFGKSFYEKELSFLEQQKQQSLEKIQESYRQDMERIKLDTIFNEEEKEEAIANATEQFIQAHEGLNFSSEIAYRNASKEIKRAAEDIAHIGAQKYLARMTANTEGNLGGIDAQSITQALKRMREDIEGNHEIQQQEIAMKRQSVFSDLESRVGTEQAQKLLSQAEQEDPSLSNTNIQTLLGFARSGNAKTERRNTTLKETSYNNSLNIGGFSPRSTNVQGAIQNKYSATQRQNQLLQQNIKNNAGLNQSNVQQGFNKSQFYLDKERDTNAVEYMQKNIQNTPYYWNNGNLVIGKKAEEKGKSINQQNKWTHQLKASTWRLY